MASKKGQFPSSFTLPRKLSLVEFLLTSLRLTWPEGGYDIRRPGAFGRQPGKLKASASEALRSSRSCAVVRIAHERNEDAGPVVGAHHIVLQIVGIGWRNLVRTEERGVDGNALILLLRTALQLLWTRHRVARLILAGVRVNNAVS